MSSQNQSTPDLATVLKTLAALNSRNHQNPSEHSQSESIMAPESPDYEPAPATEPAPPAPTLESYLARPTPPSKGAAQPKVVDPASIIDWSSGLKSVMKTFASNEAIVKDIKRLIKVQHEHEEQWWKARGDLIEKQKARVEGQKQIDSILKGVGGDAAKKSEVSTPEELAKELKSFDMKVYKAQIQMNQEFTTKLRGLGIPFFGTKSNLVRRKGDKAKLEKGMIAEVELVKLQRKMLELLEDMAKGD